MAAQPGRGRRRSVSPQSANNGAQQVPLGPMVLRAMAAGSACEKVGELSAATLAELVRCARLGDGAAERGGAGMHLEIDARRGRVLQVVCRAEGDAVQA